MSQGSGVQVPPGVFAGVAQSVERMTLNHVVAGSSPAIGKAMLYKYCMLGCQSGPIVLTPSIEYLLLFFYSFSRDFIVFSATKSKISFSFTGKLNPSWTRV